MLSDTMRRPPVPNLVTVTTAPLPAELTSLAEMAQNYAEAASSANTRASNASQVWISAKMPPCEWRW